MYLLWVQGGYANFCFCCTKQKVVVVVNSETRVSIVTIPRVLPDGSVHTMFALLEIAATIAVATELWTSFNTTFAIVIIVLVIIWVQCLVYN